MTIKNNSNNNNKSKPPVGGGGADTAVNRTTTDDTIGTAFIAPMGGGRSSGGGVGSSGKKFYRTPSGDLIELNADRQRIIDSGYTILSGEDKIPTPTGPNTWETVSSAELRRRTEEDRLYDGRYEGRSTGYPEDPDNFAPSGLKVRGPSRQ